MTERAAPIDAATMQAGLLMESAQAHQKMAEFHLDRLKAHTQGLDGVVREEIRRTLIEELQELTTESRRAARALNGMNRAAQMRGLLWIVAIAVLGTVIPGLFARWVLPSANEIAALRAERDRLIASISRLEQHGGKIDWRHCGDAARLCVRIDRSAPSFGDQADYMILKGF
jgi:hypothetical protein